MIVLKTFRGKSDGYQSLHGKGDSFNSETAQNDLHQDRHLVQRSLLKRAHERLPAEPPATIAVNDGMSPAQRTQVIEIRNGLQELIRQNHQEHAAIAQRQQAGRRPTNSQKRALYWHQQAWARAVSRGHELVNTQDFERDQRQRYDREHGRFNRNPDSSGRCMCCGFRLRGSW